MAAPEVTAGGDRGSVASEGEGNEVTDRRRLTGEETRNRILDVAQELFAKHGYDGVSMRQITVGANANVASIHYHFGSKEKLLLEALRRGAAPLIERRSESLSLLPRPLQLEDVIRAFVTPVFQGERAPGTRRLLFGELRSRLVFENGALADQLLSELFDASSRSYIEAIADCLPDLPRSDLYYRFHYFLGAMFYAMSGTNRIKAISRGECDPTNSTAAIEQLIHFVSAGFRAPSSGH
mgnify:CR=1 FL=1